MNSGANEARNEVEEHNLSCIFIPGAFFNDSTSSFNGNPLLWEGSGVICMPRKSLLPQSRRKRWKANKQSEGTDKQTSQQKEINK